jgi:hypothetical protein
MSLNTAPNKWVISGNYPLLCEHVKSKRKKTENAKHAGILSRRKALCARKAAPLV